MASTVSPRLVRRIFVGLGLLALLQMGGIIGYELWTGMAEGGSPGKEEPQPSANVTRAELFSTG